MRYLRMDEMVEQSGLSRYTIMKELQEGRLHGGQRKKRGTWTVDEACFHAWMRGRATAGRFTRSRLSDHSYSAARVRFPVHRLQLVH